eukprot:scaffold4280_cov57-Cyclotella_meneghiniana.AAC.3
MKRIEAAERQKKRDAEENAVKSRRLYGRGVCEFRGDEDEVASTLQLLLIMCKVLNHDRGVPSSTDGLTKLVAYGSRLNLQATCVSLFV